MELCHSWAQIPLRLSATRRYSAWQLREKCRHVSPPFWLRVEGQTIPVSDEACLQLACRASAAYHDWLAYNVPEDDGFALDMFQRELKIQAHMDEPSSEESDNADDSEP
jgi:hypothetical protein